MDRLLQRMPVFKRQQEKEEGPQQVGRNQAWPLKACRRMRMTGWRVAHRPGGSPAARGGSECGPRRLCRGSGGRTLSAAQQYLLGTSCVPSHVLQTLGAAALAPPRGLLEVQTLGSCPHLLNEHLQHSRVPE